MAEPSESALRDRPDAFVGIQFRCIGRESLEMKTWNLTAHRAHGIAFVDVAFFPDDGHVPSKMTQEVAQEQARLPLTDVVAAKLELEANRRRIGLTDTPELTETHL